MITCTNCNLKQGSTGDDVKTDQRRLFYLGYYTGKIDGDYGPYTVKATEAYQKAAGLVVDGWTGPKTCNSLLLPYICPSNNCQSDNTAIIAKAAALGNNATNIFNWVRDAKNYVFYNNTRLGALKMLTAQGGNCTDLSHLLIALLRAAGIPARYVHGLVNFKTDGQLGHTWVQACLNGGWVNMDTSNNNDTIGTIAGTVVKIYGTYRELPY